MGWSPVVGLLQSAGSGFAPVFVCVRGRIDRKALLATPGVVK